MDIFFTEIITYGGHLFDMFPDPRMDSLWSSAWNLTQTALQAALGRWFRVQFKIQQNSRYTVLNFCFPWEPPLVRSIQVVRVPYHDGHSPDWVFPGVPCVRFGVLAGVESFQAILQHATFDVGRAKAVHLNGMSVQVKVGLGKRKGTQNEPIRNSIPVLPGESIPCRSLPSLVPFKQEHVQV